MDESLRNIRGRMGSDWMPHGRTVVRVATRAPGAWPAWNEYSGERELTQDQALLIGEGELLDFRARWDELQGTFVDEPRRAVDDAEALVAAVAERSGNGFGDGFVDERAELEQQRAAAGNLSGDPATEELRLTLKNYGALFRRLLAALSWRSFHYSR